jgi:hypothetical protein
MKPATAFRSVDFPQPEGPITITFSRGATEKVASATASVKPEAVQ